MFLHINMYQHLPVARTLPAPPITTGTWRSKRPANMPPLMKQSLWHGCGGTDAHIYLPSPPMTTSPTSPKRSQFPEERPQLATLYEVASGVTSAPGSETVRSTTMATQLLPAPVGPSPYIFGSHHPSPGYLDHRHDIQPRPRAQSIPPYQGAFQPTAYGQQSMLGIHGHGAQLAPAIGGPVSMGAPVVGRLPRTGSRRAKAHVARACQNCKKAHLSCDEQRPCTRCVATRKEVWLWTSRFERIFC
jgi:hypothetical protein